MNITNEVDIEALEIDLLLEGIYQRFGHDLRGYRREQIQRQLHRCIDACALDTISALQSRILRDDVAGDTLLRALLQRPVPLFHDGAHFSRLRTALCPLVRSRAAPKIWVAECGSMEEVFSLAIFLHEEGLYDRTRIFVTSSSETHLEDLARGRFKLEYADLYAQNYRSSGGRYALSDYFDVVDGYGVFVPHLRARITWAQHSLVTDSSFNEFELIACHGALADFGPLLTSRTLKLFRASLTPFGILSLSGVEQLPGIPFNVGYTPLFQQSGLLRRIA